MFHHPLFGFDLATDHWVTIPFGGGVVCWVA
jgi:hypothetical protein